MTNFSPSQVSPHELEFELDANTVLPDLAHAARTVELARRAERQNLSRELHDTVVQPLTALAAALELLPPLPLSAEAIMATGPHRRAAIASRSAAILTTTICVVRIVRIPAPIR